MILKLSYIGLTIIMMVVIFLIARHTVNKTFEAKKAKSKLLQLALGLILWQIYTYLMTLTGLLQDFSLPPRFAVFLIVPAFIFTGIFLYKNRNSEWIQNIPLHWLVFYQSFRILIETIFVYSVAAKVLHPTVTIEGYNYDMVFAYTALIVGFLVMRNYTKFKRLALYWNYLGIVVIAFIIFLFQESIYFPGFFGEPILEFPMEATMYPYVLVAGFLMPSAVFMHVLSIIQIRKKL